MSRRMSFIMQLARTADEVGWLEHEVELSGICGTSLADQPERLRQLAARINMIADRIQVCAETKEVA